MSSVPCPVCEAELVSELLGTMALDTPRGSRAWSRCPDCRSFFSQEPYSPREEMEHTRTRPWGMAESGIFLNDDKSPMYEAILRELRTRTVRGGTLLDIGCSFGGFLYRAEREGYRVRGMDIVPEAVEYVRGHGIRCDRAESVGNLDLPHNSLTVVSVLDCNYYWPNQRRELRAIHSCLEPGGLLAMRVVDTSWAVRIGHWLSQRFHSAAGKRLCEKAVYDHRVSIPVRSLLRIVRQEGFDVVYTSQYDAMPFRHNSLKVKAAYAIGWLALHVAGSYVAPAFVLLARKQPS